MKANASRRLAGTGLALCLLLPPARMRAQMSPFWYTLTGNATGEEGGLAADASYTAAPPYANPPDSGGRRLLDRGGEWNDWNNTVGFNGDAQTLTFDLHAVYKVRGIQFQFDMPQKPASVRVECSENSGGPWTAFGKLEPGERSGWHDLIGVRPILARYVRMDFRLKTWGWYLREVKIRGTLRGEPDAAEKLLPLRQGNALLLSKSGEPHARIVTAAQPTAKVVRAALDLQQTLYRISGAVLPICPDTQTWSGTRLLVGPSKAMREAGIPPPQSYPGNETILVQTRGDAILLVGSDDGAYCGTELAVQTFLERLGCGWFGPDPLWQPIPHLPTIAVAPMQITHTASFASRDLWIGAGKRWYLGGLPASFSHAQADLFPPAQYFAAHPEYYALVGGKRIASGEWQLCLSNSDVQRLTMEKARAYFDQNPDAQMFSISNNDCGGYCECAECQKMGGTNGARMLTFAGRVAAELRKTHPTKYISFLAYWYTRQAPMQKAAPGVWVWVVNDGCHAHAITDVSCPVNREWKAEFERWTATGARIGLYEWYIPGYEVSLWRRLPWFSGEVGTKNLDYARTQGVTSVTIESQNGYEEQAYPRRWAQFYAASKHLWDASLSEDALMSDACRKLFGAGANAMRRYYEAQADAMRQCVKHGGNWNLPPAQDVFTPAVRTRLRRALSDAKAAVRNADAETAQRVAVEMQLWEMAERALQKASSPPAKNSRRQ